MTVQINSHIGWLSDLSDLHFVISNLSHDNFKYIEAEEIKCLGSSNVLSSTSSRGFGANGDPDDCAKQYEQIIARFKRRGLL